VVYCIERPAEAADAVDTELFEIDADAEVAETAREGVAPALTLRGRVRDDSAWRGSGWRARDGRPERTGASAAIDAIPYAEWANRGPSQMRVWIPTVG